MELIHEKRESKKSGATVPLTEQCAVCGGGDQRSTREKPRLTNSEQTTWITVATWGEIQSHAFSMYFWLSSEWEILYFRGNTSATFLVRPMIMKS
jgi:hypothetical protein